MSKLKIIFFAFFLTLGFFAAVPAFAGNIDSTFRWSWSENIGWIDFYNVTVSSSELTGTSTAVSIGDISLNCSNTNACGQSNFKVANSGYGTLSGWAWSENIGWISFCGSAASPSTWNGTTWVCPASPTYKVTINTSGYFSGWAWSENIGWISFSCANTIPLCNGTAGNWKVKTSWAAAVFVSGELISTIYDSRIAGGVACNTLLWKGDKPDNTDVKFQIASSNCTNGATNPPTCSTNVGWANKFKGWDGTAATSYNPSPDIWVRIDGPGAGTDGCQISPGVACHNNHRYLRYKVILESWQAGVTPRIDMVILSWSP